MNAWAFYDWANSVYSLVITSAIFPIFYSALFADQPLVQFLGFEVKNSALISFVTAGAFLVVSAMSPLLSGIADYVGNKKQFLQFFCYLGALACIGLYWFSADNLGWGLLFYFLGLIGFWGSMVFYNSFLPDIAPKEVQDRLSAKGYSLGYAGSVILLVVNLAMVMKPEVFGITGTPGEAAMKAMRYSFITVGIWWILFAQYTFYHLPKGPREKLRVSRHIVFNGFRELKKVYHSLAGLVILKRYLSGFFVYSMAVQTVMLVATYFGAQEIRWTSKEEGTTGLIICILLIQLVAIAGAFLTSRASRQWGNIRVLIAINLFWLGLCIAAFFVIDPIQFYVMAALVGLVMGGIQALSRSTYSKLLPQTLDTASYFSFYDVAEKIGIVIGMILYGLIDQAYGPRYSIVFLGIFFLVGILLLLRIPQKSAT